MANAQMRVQSFADRRADRIAWPDRLHVEHLDVFQKVLLQSLALADHLARADGEAQGRSANLNERLVRGSIDAQHDRCAGHALKATDAAHDGMVVSSSRTYGIALISRCDHCVNVLCEQAQASPPRSAPAPQNSSFVAHAIAVILGAGDWVHMATSQGFDRKEAAVMLQFNAENTRLLDNAYRGSDFIKRRLAILEALAPQANESIVDVGSGLGHLTVDLSRAVGDAGEVIGIDPSADMRKGAASQCDELPNVRILDGTAAALPLDDGCADRAVSLQVFEYLSDIPGALIEIRRVLRPDGRLVVGDMHWDSWIWHSDKPDRMARMMKAWDHHLADRCVPARLPHLMRQSGYEVVSIKPLVFLDTALRCDGLAMMLLNLMQPFAIQDGLVDERTVRGWADEQRRLAVDGRFFFSLVHFIISGRRR
jgi:arsenite methyltransferase